MEKIKVYVTKQIYETLQKDMDLFNFVKSNGEINSNLFINTLIKNFYDETKTNEDNLVNDIFKIINDETNLKNDKVKMLAEKITDYVLEHKSAAEANDMIVTFKPTKLSSEAFLNIEYLLNSKGYSKYFRTLFNSYASKPLYTREQIIFKDKVDKINEAIKNNKALSFMIGKSRNVYYPYKLVQSKEELFNYLICLNEDNHVHTFRLSNISEVIITKNNYSISNELKEKLNEVIKIGVEYSCDSERIHEYVVRLTNQGIKKYRKIYIHRPKATKIEGDTYYFRCSGEQIRNYFFKFGKDAYVVSPSYLSKKLRIEFKEASKHYYDEYQKELNGNN